MITHERARELGEGGLSVDDAITTAFSVEGDAGDRLFVLLCATVGRCPACEAERLTEERRLMS